VADACTITPALRTWIECLVDNRVDQSCRTLREGELATLVSATRREGAAASASAMAAVQQADQARQRLELQVRSLADAQARLLAVVEGFSGDAERQQSSSSKARADALVTVERVMSTVNELQRTVEQEGDSANARLRQHEAVLEELRRIQSEDAMRHRAALSELQRLQSEASARQRQISDELAGACSTIAATRHEVGDFAQMVQRLEMKLSSWRMEVAAEVSEEVRATVAAREADTDSERLKLESVQREVAGACAARIELEARLEGLRVELAGAISMRGDLEARLREGQQALVRRVDGLQAAATKDVDGAKQELEELVQHVQRLEQRFGAWRAEVSKEIRAAGMAREAVELAREQGAAGLEGLRREASQQWAEAESRLERLQVELATVAATRDSFEFRIREGQEELKKTLDVWQGRLRDELGALQRRLTTELESWQGSTKEELASLQRRLGAELRAETRALLKSEQNTLAALDEQLWLTDQRLGQRIDELVQVAGRGERIAAVAAAAEMAARSPAPRTPLLESRGRGAAAAEARAFAEPLAEAAAEAEVRRSLIPRLSDAEQLQRLRSARRRSALAAGEEAEAAPEARSAARAGGDRGSALAMAREAAEAFEELARPVE